MFKYETCLTFRFLFTSPTGNINGTAIIIDLNTLSPFTLSHFMPPISSEKSRNYFFTYPHNSFTISLIFLFKKSLCYNSIVHILLEYSHWPKMYSSCTSWAKKWGRSSELLQISRLERAGGRYQDHQVAKLTIKRLVWANILLHSASRLIRALCPAPETSGGKGEREWAKDTGKREAPWLRLLTWGYGCRCYASSWKSSSSSSLERWWSIT